MPRPRLHDETLVPPTGAGQPRARYLVVRQEDLWFIQFDDEEFGPYKTDREAMMFAIDAAQKLGEQGEQTQVLLKGTNGNTLAVWTRGQHPYRF
jgi:hypothetical protein